jgi:hexosaminidase
MTIGQPLPPLIPTPTTIARATGEPFTLDAATIIVLDTNASAATIFAARGLALAIADATGLTPQLRKGAAGLDARNLITLTVIAGDGGAEGPAGTEGYTLRSDAGRIAIVGGGEAGLFYGVQTLRQLLRTQGRRLPALAISDAPALPHRGLMLDVTRGKVPTLETLFGLVDGLAAYKYNQLQLYIEHTFRFPSHPAIGAGAGSYTADDMLALDTYCRERHIAFVPNLQSFGHQRATLGLPEYAHLDEVGWQWTLTPAQEGTYALLADLYADFLPNFASEWFNVDCDETWDLGTGQSRALATALGQGRLYLSHILRLRELAARHGRKIMLWADVINHYPDLLPEVPKDMILLDWSYEAKDMYPTVVPLGTSGRTFFVCPGTSSWNTLFPRIDNAIGNIRDYTIDGIAHGATGMLLTDWGDMGHYQALSLSWYPYLFGAAVAWSGGQAEPEEFDDAFAPLFLGVPAGSPAIVALRRLGSAVTGPTLALPNRSNSAYALFDDPLKGRLIDTVDPAALTELRDAARAAAAAWVTLPDPALRHDYCFTARLIDFAATKTLRGQATRATLRALASEADRTVALAQLDAAIDALAESSAEIPALVAEFEAVWLRHARRSEIGLTLDRYTALAARCTLALGWLREQRERFAAGGALDHAADSYDPGEYRVLWDESRAGIQRLGELSGIDALPESLRQLLTNGH